MALSDLIAADVTNVVFNTADFAETVEREVGSDPDSRQTQTAIVYREQEDTDTTRGKAFVTRYRMDLLEAADVQQSDSYLIGKEHFRVVNIDDAENGIKHVELVRIEDVRTEANGVRFLR